MFGLLSKLWTKKFNDNTTEGKSEKLTENCVDLITYYGRIGNNYKSIRS